jgi:methyltransferase
MVFVALAIVVALLERRVSFVNERRMLGEGAEEIAPWVFRLMIPVYSLIFAAAVAEHLLDRRRPPVLLVGGMLVLFVLSKALKFWAIRHLRDEWTMKVILPARFRVVTSGPYRHLRHPNYIAVMGEILALPLAGGAYVTALAGAGSFFVILFFRVRTEEAALLARPEYAGSMGRRRRFLPGR